METAGEGGAWGIALLADYMKERKDGESLGDFLADRVFAGEKGEKVWPDKDDVASFDAVSYTHLDVYKRQFLPGASGSL